MFGEKLRELRKQKKLTQADLGSKIGVSPSAIGMYEQGNREPDNDTLLKLCEVFNVTTDYLINSELKQSIFFSPDYDHELLNVVDLFTKTLIKQNNIFYKKQKLQQKDLQKISDAIKMAVNYYLSSEGFN